MNAYRSHHLRRHAVRPLATSRHLLRMDQEPIRSQVRRDYEKAEKTLQKVREEHRKYQEEELPAFTQWLNREFGAQLTAIRTWVQQADEKRLLLMEIEEEVLYYGISPHAAYQRILYRRAHPEEATTPPDKSRSASDADDDPFDEFDARQSRPSRGGDSWGARDDPKEDDEVSFEDFFAKMFGFRPLGPKPHRSPHSPPQPQDTRLKDLYREAVRRLHPDTRKHSTARHLEWWHQVQEAYRKKDADQIEWIITLCDMEDKDKTIHPRVSVLMPITQQYRRTVNQIRRELAGFRKHPAWNFSSKNRTQLIRMIGGNLAMDRLQAEYEYQELERILIQYTQPPQRRTPKRGRPKSRSR